MSRPFEASPDELREDIDAYVDEVFAALESGFLSMPRGDGFIDYAVFEQGYEALRGATANFTDVTRPAVEEAVYRQPVALVVLRAMLGFTPPEWAYVASAHTGLDIPQGAVRTLDREIRLAPAVPIVAPSALAASRISALIETACHLLTEGAPVVQADLIHRLDKADTRDGLVGLRNLAQLGVPYAMLLYERFLGRPFAGHRDSVSELVGDVLETAIERVLHDGRISFRKTKRAERIAGFDQAPDFIIPSEFNPKVVIEAKLTEDDGTARDKVTRVQHLAALAREGIPDGSPPRFEVVACIAGRGFRVRREDMRKLLLATAGKVFALNQVEHILEHTAVAGYRSRRQP